MAYLLSRYPAVSHTFFLKEVLGLRQRGLQIETASINCPDRPIDALPPVEAVEANRTFYVKAGGPARLLVRVVAVALAHPGVTLRGLGAALSLGRLDLKAHAYALFYLAEALLIGKWMRNNSLSHLHVHFGGPVATVGMLTSRAWRLPYSVTLHGPDEFFDQDAFYLQKKVESASFIVCISDFCRSQVLRISPTLGDQRLETVRLGVDCDSLHPDLHAKSAGQGSSTRPDRPIHIVCTGRMVAAKGHRILLEALAPLLAGGTQFTCTLIGDGPERSSLEALAQRLGLTCHLSFLGAMAHQPTLAEVAKADIFVLASFAEGLPVALMEAMAFGIPCVSTSIAAIPELIHDKVNGFVVPAANPNALANAIHSLASSRDLRQQFGANARETVVQDYNLANNLDLLYETWLRRLSSR